MVGDWKRRLSAAKRIISDEFYIEKLIFFLWPHAFRAGTTALNCSTHM
jgi:hypothetical protein